MSEFDDLPDDEKEELNSWLDELDKEAILNDPFFKSASNHEKEHPDQPDEGSNHEEWTPAQRRYMTNWLEEFTIDQYGGRSIRDVPPEIREGIKTFFEPS